MFLSITPIKPEIAPTERVCHDSLDRPQEASISRVLFQDDGQIVGSSRGLLLGPNNVTRQFDLDREFFGFQQVKIDSRGSRYHCAF